MSFRPLLSRTSHFVSALLPFLLLAGSGFATEVPYGAGKGYTRDCTLLIHTRNASEVNGPRILFRASEDPLRLPLEQIDRLKVVTYNALELNHEGATREKVSALARNLKNERANILVLVEVESIQELEKLNRALGDQYYSVMVHGNDDEKNIGYLINRRLGLDFTLQSHKNMARSADASVKTFTRDFPVLIFQKPGSPDPLFILAGVHLKAQRGGPERAHSLERRAEEIAKITGLLRSDYEGRFADPVPIFLTGDFNADVSRSTDFRPLQDLGFRDAFDTKGVGPGKLARATHSFFNRKGSVSYQQLDGFFTNGISQEAGLILDVHVAPDVAADGSRLGLPKSFEERSKNASDHRPLSVTLDFKKIRLRELRPPALSH